MANGNYVLPAPEKIEIPGEAARRLIGCGSGDAALTYLYIMKSGGRFDCEDCALHTGRTVSQIESAYSVLENLGLVTKRAAKESEPERPEEIPQYTTEEIRRELSNGESFRRIVDEVQRTMGRLLSGDEIQRLYGFYDYLELPGEVIILLVRYCISEAQRRGSGRMPSFRYMEKVAFSWRREGIFTLEAAESHVERESERRDAYFEAAKAMRVRDRLLTDTEKKYVDSWRSLGFGADALAIAADRTITQTGKLGMRYMNSILNSWHAKGLHTAEEIERGDSYAQPRNTGKAANPQHTEVTARDAEKNREALKRIKEG